MVELVVLTDFSTAADKALHYATNLATQLPATIHLVHIWPQSVLNPNYFVEVPASSSYFENARVSSRQEHEQALLKRTGVFGRETPIAPHFLEGTIADQLPAFLKQMANPLVVIGKKDTDNLPDEMVESTAVQLLVLKNTAFLVVPEKYRLHAPPKRIAVALHEKEIKHRNHIFDEFILALRPEITVVHVATHPDEGLQAKLTEHAQTGLGLAAPQVLVFQDDAVMKRISKYCKEKEEDLLVLIHRKHAFLLNFFHQSVTGNFIRHTAIPLLILPG